MTTEADPRAWTLGPWPFDDTTLMLTLHSAHRADAGIDAALVAEWSDATETSDFQRLRTSAVGPAVADALLSFGFVVRQELHFLVVDLREITDSETRGPWRVGRVRPADAVRIDVAAFGDEWALDENAFRNSCLATRIFRTRGVRGRLSLPGSRPMGFCLTGASDESAYLQRLAVVPSAQRRGAASVLLEDATKWARTIGAKTMFVNTDVDNVAALSLYRRWGFESVGYRLRVMECDRVTLRAAGWS